MLRNRTACLSLSTSIIYLYMHVCVCVCMCVYLYMCMYVYMYVYLYMCVCVCVRVYIYIYTHTHTHIYIYTYIHVTLPSQWQAEIRNIHTIFHCLFHRSFLTLKANSASVSPIGRQPRGCDYAMLYYTLNAELFLQPQLTSHREHSRCWSNFQHFLTKNMAIRYHGN